jgi:hypothetical protein
VKLDVERSRDFSEAGHCPNPSATATQLLFTMALPKSMRYLAGATFCIFVYLFVQILKAPGSDTPVEIPSKLPTNKLGDWDHDPQLDRKLLRSRVWTWHKY